MIIGTVSPEEARVFDSSAGYHRVGPASIQVVWHNGPDRIGGPYAYRSPAVVDVDGHQMVDGLTGTRFHDEEDPATVLPAGWYWWACLPGCLPDSEPVGPFARSSIALEDARDQWDDLADV